MPDSSGTLPVLVVGDQVEYQVTESRALLLKAFHVLQYRIQMILINVL